MSLTVGMKAPDFTLFDHEKKSRTLAEFVGKKIVLAFYPGAFTGVCTKEMCAFRDSMARLNSLNAHVLGISVDAPFANKAFAEKNQLNFPLLSDYERTISKKYGGVHENFGGLTGYTASKRAVFVLDGKTTIQYVWVTDNPGDEPKYDEIEKVLAAIS